VLASRNGVAGACMPMDPHYIETASPDLMEGRGEIAGAGFHFLVPLLHFVSTPSARDPDAPDAMSGV
jgi:hypothetical protein